MGENYNLLEPHHFGEKPPRRVNNLYLWIILAAVGAGLALGIYLKRAPEAENPAKEAAGSQTEVQIEYQQVDEGGGTASASRQIGPSTVSEHSYHRVAIIIDDLGYNLQAARRFIEMEAPLSFAILPQIVYSKQIADLVHEHGREAILHLPMEPLDYPETNPGPGAILSSMTQQEIIDTLNRDLVSVPQVIGINNHMGSKLTTDAPAMETVMHYLKNHELFFIDSLTVPGTVAYATARKIGLKTARRTIFLDNKDDAEAISRNIMILAEKAKKVDGLIAIAHPHLKTYKALKETLPILENDGIRIVPISELVK